MSVCFSKGLGAPVGSALCGPAELIRKARRHRKALGGAMRQAGIIAAGALYALDHHIERLAEDHEKARVLADAIRQTPGLTLDPDVVDTNIVIFKIAPQLGTAAEFTAKLREQGVLMNPAGRHRIRAVTHLDVSLSKYARPANCWQILPFREQLPSLSLKFSCHLHHQRRIIRIDTVAHDWSFLCHLPYQTKTSKRWA